MIKDNFAMLFQPRYNPSVFVLHNKYVLPKRSEVWNLLFAVFGPCRTLSTTLNRTQRLPCRLNASFLNHPNTSTPCSNRSKFLIILNTGTVYFFCLD